MEELYGGGVVEDARGAAAGVDIAVCQKYPQDINKPQEKITKTSISFRESSEVLDLLAHCSSPSS